jgi:hypothetical protein
MKPMRIWLARTLIGIVIFFNLQCAIAFLLFPLNYTSGFELQGSAGEAVVRGIGLLFVMWNIPYFFAAWHPVKHFILVIETCIMQAIGVIGESVIMLTLSGDHPAARQTISRFIFFDAAGLLILLAAGWLTLQIRHTQQIRKQTTAPGH